MTVVAMVQTVPGSMQGRHRVGGESQPQTPCTRSQVCRTTLYSVTLSHILCWHLGGTGCRAGFNMGKIRKRCFLNSNILKRGKWFSESINICRCI